MSDSSPRTPRDEEWVSLETKESKESKDNSLSIEIDTDETETKELTDATNASNIEIETKEEDIVTTEVKKKRKRQQSSRWCHVFTRMGVCPYGETCRFRHMKTFEERNEATSFVAHLYRQCPPCRRAHCPNLISSRSRALYCPNCETLVKTSRYVLQKVFY